jgi:hypothetical protein
MEIVFLDRVTLVEFVQCEVGCDDPVILTPKGRKAISQPLEIEVLGQVWVILCGIHEVFVNFWRDHKPKALGFHLRINLKLRGSGWFWGFRGRLGKEILVSRS